MLDYFSEKLGDTITDKIKQEKENLDLRNALYVYLKRQKDEFEQSGLEFDFDALMSRIEASMLNETALKKLVESDAKTRNQAKESIRISCVQAALSIDGLDDKKSFDTSNFEPIHVQNKSEAQQKVEEIVNQCFNIIADFYDSNISKPDSVLACKSVDAVNAHADANKAELKQEFGLVGDEMLKFMKEIKAVLPQKPASPPKQADNKDYLDRFTEPLFLEKDEESQVTLASMYVSPHRIGIEDTAAECIMTWFGQNTRKTCMLLYGNAGVGKSSLVSKIIADANQKGGVEREFDLTADQVLAIALRNHCDKIDMNKKVDEILEFLFEGYALDELQSKLLILDGLDEVCVLKHGFDGHTFLEKMSKLKSGFHVLVTSREAKDYFSDPEDIIRLQIEHFQWTQDEVTQWCAKYREAATDKEAWCTQFIQDFNALNQNDLRRGIFCVPIILYICGYSGINLTNHNSIGSIYKDAFQKILLRTHIQWEEGHGELVAADVESNLIIWQYTKELAYQMFLLDTLDLAESNDPNNPHTKGLVNARIRTKAILKEKYGIDVAVDALDSKKELALCPFTKANGTLGITFAHKTVYEYFTAVKLYEDYFAKFNTDYFGEHADSVKKEVIESFVEAFRYSAITPDIFTFLINMDSPAFSRDKRDLLPTKKIPANRKFDKQKFMDAFVSGVKENQFGRLGIQPPVEEYLISDYNILEQISLAFCNFTWYCTGMGYKNNIENRADIERIIKELPYSPKIICCQGWKMQSADLSESKLNRASMLRANLREADLRNSVLPGATFSGAHLERAHLEGAHLEGAVFEIAFLKGARFDFSYLIQAYFTGSDCERIHFEKADLRGARLEEANLSYACLNNAILDGTFFNNAHLEYARFENSKLINTIFLEAHLEGAIFTGCSLDYAILKGAFYDKTTIFPDGFSPKERSMIEVDKDGNPVV